MSTHGQGTHHHPPFFVRWPLIPMAASFLTWWFIEHHAHESLPAPWPEVLAHPIADCVVEGTVFTVYVLCGQLRLRWLGWIAFLVGGVAVIVVASSFVPVSPSSQMPWVSGAACVLAWAGSVALLALLFRVLTNQEAEPESEGIVGYPFADDKPPNHLFAQVGQVFVVFLLYVAVSAAGAGLLGIIWWTALQASFLASFVVVCLAEALALLLLYTVFRLGENWQSLNQQWADMRDLADYGRAMGEWEGQRDIPEQQKEAGTPPSSFLAQLFAVATAWAVAGPLLHPLFLFEGASTFLPDSVDWFLLFFVAGVACFLVSSGLRLLFRTQWGDCLCLAGVLIGGILGYWLPGEAAWPVRVSCTTLAAFCMGCVSLTSGSLFDLLHGDRAEGRPV